MDDLESTATRLSRAARRSAVLRLVAGALGSAALLLNGEDAAAIVVAIFVGAFAYTRAVREGVYQLKLTVGALGMIVEELRALHVRAVRRQTDGMRMSNDQNDGDDWDEEGGADSLVEEDGA